MSIKGPLSNGENLKVEWLEGSKVKLWLSGEEISILDVPKDVRFAELMQLSRDHAVYSFLTKSEQRFGGEMSVKRIDWGDEL